MKNTTKEVLVAGSGMVANFATSFTISYGCDLLGAILWYSGHKVLGTMTIATGNIAALKKGADANKWCSNIVAELVDLDYWWLLNKEEDEDEKVEEESTEKEA